jgi:hypothetical protein
METPRRTMYTDVSKGYLRATQWNYYELVRSWQDIHGQNPKSMMMMVINGS